uniref:Uncharacterized protein n=1 Tax=Knipowitschia caucasica TaxID=637954 RepID=A0AAV2LN35_KNICA
MIHTPAPANILWCEPHASSHSPVLVTPPAVGAAQAWSTRRSTRRSTRLQLALIVSNCDISTAPASSVGTSERKKSLDVDICEGNQRGQIYHHFLDAIEPNIGIHDRE